MKNEILIIDDIESNRTVLSKLIKKVCEMQKKECNIFFCENPLDCLNKEIEKYNYIFTDNHLPNIYGLDFINIIHRKYKHGKIYLVTGFFLPEEQIEQPDIYTYIKKPIKFEDIKKIVNNFS
jgi:response regulator RpfG family c-di-GMP phosphodiesterase